jgi:FkbM family methyltransferase
MKVVRLIIIRPLGIVRRIFLKYASMGQVLVPPTKTWTYQRDHFLRSLGISLAIDVGGNLGQWALEARKLITAQITTFEPDPRCKTHLDELSEGDPHWDIVEKAAGNSNSIAQLKLLKVEHGYSSLKRITALGEDFAGELNDEIRTTPVPVVRLDNHFAANSPTRESIWLKIDVQGYEYHLLKGANELIIKFKPVIFLENPILGEEDIKSSYITKNHLLDIGYEFYRIHLNNKEDCIKTLESNGFFIILEI